MCATKVKMYIAKARVQTGALALTAKLEKEKEGQYVTRHIII